MDLTTLRTSACLDIVATQERLYAFIAEMSRMGEISPECVGGSWVSDARGPGAIFIGLNAAGDTRWRRRIRIETANPPYEFSWLNLGDPDESVDEGPGIARWGFAFRPIDGGTRVEETWALINEHPRLSALGVEGLRGLRSRFERGMEMTLANLKVLMEGFQVG
jgi:hypothetical protein